MKTAGAKLAALMAASAVLLGGCGEAPYELTEQESNIIANYAAHIVMKYDLNQKEGLQYVKMDSADAGEPAGDSEQEITDDTGASGGTEVADGDVSQTDGEVQMTLQDLFGTDTLNVEYSGYELSANYTENDYYVLNAQAGKQYLVLHIAVTNNGDAEETVDNLSKNATFEVNFDGTVHAVSELTVLMEDFSTYQETVGVAETADTVLLFQVPDTVTEVQNVTLSVSVDGNNYQIIL